VTVETAELAPGYRISRLIRGGWQLAGGHGPVERARAVADMRAFLDAGVTTFDGADIYTGVEEMYGEFRAGLPAEDRARLRLHTKFVPDWDALPTWTPPMWSASSTAPSCGCGRNGWTSSSSTGGTMRSLASSRRRCTCGSCSAAARSG
jgi:aryl-alcohol dehydrogenase-like predicted oxidoreductase